MNKPPLWFSLVVGLALLWNLAGLFAVANDLRQAAAEVAAMSVAQQAVRAALPWWTPVASVVAVVGGCLGCLGLLLRRRWAQVLLAASLAGVVIQNLGIALAVRASPSTDNLPFALQFVVLVVALALIALARFARSSGWLR